MKLSKEIIQTILDAESKALATSGDTINVVPVSTVRIVNNNIILVDYFMGKTLDNLQKNQHVSLVCWSGFHGYQIKATVEYKQNGNVFNTTKKWVQETYNNNNKIKGILVLTPTRVFDISPNKDQAGKEAV